MINLGKNMTKNFVACKKVKLVRGGREYFDLLQELIGKARESIHLQTYIFDDDETGETIALALKEAANRNVQVFLLVDGYASQVMAQSFIDDLRASGIHFRFFEPLFKSRNFYFGRRLHRKLFVVDAAYAVTGGVNITNRYNDMPGKPAWLDFALYTEGEIARQLCVLCRKTWKARTMAETKSPCEKKIAGNSPATDGKARVSMRQNDWLTGKNEISTSYQHMLRDAEKQVIILCSYFLPGKLIRQQMTEAIKRGVTIKVIAASFSDVMLAKRAERWLYDWMLRNGIELYEYQDNVLHGKLAVCDDSWMTIGSYNINDLSAYASIELNLTVVAPDFVTNTRQVLDVLMNQHCKKITSDEHRKTSNILIRFTRWISYRTVRLLLFLFTYNLKNKTR